MSLYVQQSDPIEAVKSIYEIYWSIDVYAYYDMC